MKRFEYKICAPDRTWGAHASIVDIDVLNKYGEKGWEAVGVLDNKSVLLKREIQ